MHSLMQMNNIIKGESSYPFFPNLKTGLNMYVPVGWNTGLYSLIPVDFSRNSLGVMPVWLLKIELKVVFELKPAS
jgi:hypothetical protein